MAPIVIPNIYRASVEMVVGSQSVVNVFGIRGSSAGQEAAVNTALRTAWKIASGPLAYLPSALTCVQFKTMDLSSLTGGINVIADTTAGSNGGSISTMSSCALIQWNGGNRSSSSRGRLYLGPLTEVAINTDGRTLVGGQVTNINTAITNFKNSITASGFTLCVISRKHSTTTDVTSFTTESVIASQRRRIRS
jgi:hypothetical protein